LNQYSVSTRRGAQVFYKKLDTSGKLLAESIQNAFNEMPESTRNLSALTGDYYILNCTNYPSVIAECGYLSNPEEEALLITESYQDNIAYTLFKGICGYLAKESINYFN
jgi:N-acetylmuramoyl-L-alanine amidase